MSGLVPAADLCHPASGFHVFAIRSRPVAGEVEDAPNANTKQYTTRKSHRKSRFGCNPCKRKRVKCDEKRPLCGRCQRTKNPCGYSDDCSTSQVGFESIDTVKGSATNSNRGTNASSPLIVPRSLERSNRDVNLLKHYDRITGLGQDTVTCSDILVGSQAGKYRISILRLAQEVRKHGIENRPFPSFPLTNERGVFSTPTCCTPSSQSLPCISITTKSRAIGLPNILTCRSHSPTYN